MYVVAAVYVVVDAVNLMLNAYYAFGIAFMHLQMHSKTHKNNMFSQTIAL